MKESEHNRRELLEIYKLHATLADNVSQRREGANRLYVTLLTGVLASLVLFLKFTIGSVPLGVVLVVVGIVGMVLSMSWFIVIRSYRQLNTGKFQALHELEEELPYPFFKREWELLEEGKKASRYWKLTVVETFLPVAFLLLFIAFLGCGIFCLWKNC
ncbi:MAG: hypothetical protein OXC39_08240 [Candidatus Dadabacteria bacterium]|nr:hypothetical protein [Candidatus Dadabacteria bacterium]